MKFEKKGKLDFNAILSIYRIIYDVREVPSADIDDDHGRLRWRRSIIKINEELNYTNRFHTLIHEVIHTVLYHGGLEEYFKLKKIDGDIELITKILETGVSSFLLENKEKIIEWLTADKNGLVTKI